MAHILSRRAPPLSNPGLSLLAAPCPRRRATTAAPPISRSPASLLTPPGAAVQQTRSATYISRPRRPYHFTQLVQLSDGSTFTVRTTSPHAMVKSAKDTRNHLLWQPSEKSLRNIESDEAGKLAAFRERFGRGFDLDAPPPIPEAELTGAALGETTTEIEASGSPPAADYDMLGDLLSGYAEKSGLKTESGRSAKDIAKAQRKARKKKAP